MNKRYKLALILVGALAVAQLVRPARTNPPTDPKNAIASHVTNPNDLTTVLDRSCNECHSNSTVWPWYTEVAPVSWVAVSGVKKAREAVNFSEWARYSPDERQRLLDASCAAASSGKMPGSYYTWLDPRARLSSSDVATICAASKRQGVAE